MKNRSTTHRQLPEAVEIELIRSVFHAFVPALVMTLCFLAAGVEIYLRTRDPILLALLIGGMVASVARLSLVFSSREIHSKSLTITRARLLEFRFTLAYLAFALFLGMFGARALLTDSAEIHMLVMCLLFSYCAGVAVGMGLRLRIALPAMFVTLGPAVCVAMINETTIYRITGALVAAILLSGSQSLRNKHQRSVQDIGLRLTFSNLARKDPLTALPNRIAMREWYDERMVVNNGARLMAVHYLDLNGFKPVNDSHGHPVGDALLTAVGKRIARTIRDSDIVARLGGDEFAVIQYDIKNADEAAQLAARITDAICSPFRIGHLTINISAGLGYVVAKGQEEDLDHLLNLADQALYTSKRQGEVSQYDAVETITKRVA